MGKPLQVFCCYAREDQPYLLTLKKHLSPIQREGLIIVQADIDISPGEEWEQKIHHYLNTAQIILLLISPDFINSDYCYSKEMKRAMERHQTGEARVIPIILRPTHWQRAPFGVLQVLPTNAEPVTSKYWHTPDDAFFDVERGIEKGVEELLAQPTTDISSLQIMNATKNEAKSLKMLALDQSIIDFSAEADANKFEPIVGRYRELDRLIQILCRRKKNCPILIGGPGVGKTAIVKKLAVCIKGGDVPMMLAGHRLLVLNTVSLFASAQSLIEREERLEKIVKEMSNKHEWVLVIDNMPELFGTDAIEAKGNAVQHFKLALSRGDFSCIGTSTPEAYNDMLKQDKAFQTWFEEVIVQEPAPTETLEILKGIRERYESHYRLTITDEALKAAAEMGSSYITDRLMPDKAIDLIDETASRVHMQISLAPLKLKEGLRGLESVLRDKEAAIQQQKYELAAELRDREVEARKQLAELETGWHRERGDARPYVDKENIAQTVAMKTSFQ